MSSSETKNAETTQQPPSIQETKKTGDPNKEWKDPLKHLFGGGVAGAVSRTAVSPLERVKILFQVQGSGRPTKHTRIFTSLITIGKEEGFKGYFKGNGTNVIRIFPYSAVQFAAYERFKRILMTEGQKDLSPKERLIAGALAGITSVAITYPLDLIRTRLSLVEGSSYRGIGHAFMEICRVEGFWALYKGIWPTLMGIAPYVGLNFMTYETLKVEVKKWNEENNYGNPTTVQLLVCGGIAGAVAQTITYPLDVLRRKMQIQGFGGYTHYGSTWKAITNTFQQQGIIGFYRGLIPNYLKVVPSISISFVVYERTKELLKPLQFLSLLYL